MTEIWPNIDKINQASELASESLDALDENQKIELCKKLGFFEKVIEKIDDDLYEYFYNEFYKK